jgi:hypothetical protein
LAAAKNLAADELPHLLGELEEVRCTALARLHTPSLPPQEDESLDVTAAAHKLGVSRDYLYRNHARFPFTRRMGKRLLFSRNGLEKYLLTAKTYRRVDGNSLCWTAEEAMAKQEEPIIKITILLPKSLLNAAEHRGIDGGPNLQLSFMRWSGIWARKADDSEG